MIPFAKEMQRQIANSMPWILLTSNVFLEKLAQISSCDPWYWSDSIFRFYVDFLRHHKWEYFQYRMGHYSKNLMSRLHVHDIKKRTWNENKAEKWSYPCWVLDRSLPTVNLYAQGCWSLAKEYIRDVKWHFLPPVISYVARVKCTFILTVTASSLYHKKSFWFMDIICFVKEFPLNLNGLNSHIACIKNMKGFLGLNWSFIKMKASHVSRNPNVSGQPDLWALSDTIKAQI